MSPRNLRQPTSSLSSHSFPSGIDTLILQEVPEMGPADLGYQMVGGCRQWTLANSVQVQSNQTSGLKCPPEGLYPKQNVCLGFVTSAGCLSPWFSASAQHQGLPGAWLPMGLNSSPAHWQVYAPRSPAVLHVPPHHINAAIPILTGKRATPASSSSPRLPPDL